MINIEEALKLAEEFGYKDGYYLESLFGNSNYVNTIIDKINTLTNTNYPKWPKIVLNTYRKWYNKGIEDSVELLLITNNL